MDAQRLTSSQRKLVMWYKVTELKSKGLHCVQIAHELGLHRHTVEKYVKMTLEEFQASQAYERDFKYKLDIFEPQARVNVQCFAVIYKGVDDCGSDGGSRCQLKELP